MGISIVITSHNYARFIGHCIKSCLRQEGLGSTPEIVVVDDASCDETLDMLEPFRDDIRVISRDTKGGTVAAANDGILAASGEYVVRVDADDYVSSSLAARLLASLERTGSALGVACDYNIVDASGRLVRRCSAARDPISCGVLYHRNALLELGIYRPHSDCGEHEILLDRLTGGQAIERLPLPLYSYRFHGRNKRLRLDAGSAASLPPRGQSTVAVE